MGRAAAVLILRGGRSLMSRKSTIYCRLSVRRDGRRGRGGCPGPGDGGPRDSAIPPAAAQAVADRLLRAMIAADADAMAELEFDPVWVAPELHGGVAA